jgi:hypothetical protein
MLVKEFKNTEITIGENVTIKTEQTMRVVCNSDGDQWRIEKVTKQTILNAVVIGTDVVIVKTEKGLTRVEYIWID